MQDSAKDFQIPFVSLEQALTNIADSISKEELALANILNSESELIQISKEFIDNVSDFVSLNTSVNEIIKNILRLQMLLQQKSEDSQSLLAKIEEFGEYGE